jgi:hypothetical protein
VTAPVILVAVLVMGADIGACNMKFGFVKVEGSSAELEKATNCFEFWLNRYQTMVSGLLALSAAVVALWAAKLQIGHAERLEEKRRQAEENAARVRLSLALSEINDYSHECVRKFKLRLEDANYLAPLRLPSFPQSVVEPLVNCIRFANCDDARRLKDMLHWLQIFQARVTHVDLWDDRNHDYNIYDGIFDAVKTIVLLDGLWAYAREGTYPWIKTLELEEMKHCLKFLGFNEIEHHKLFDLL